MAQPIPDPEREWQEPDLPEGPLYRPEGYDGPLVCPLYGPKHPAREHRPSKSMFNKNIAALAFSSEKLAFVKEYQSELEFRGDWWLFLWLLHLTAMMEYSGEDAAADQIQLFNDVIITWYALDVFVHLEGANLAHAPLDGVCLAGAYMEGSRLCSATLRCADLGVKIVERHDGCFTNWTWSGPTYVDKVRNHEIPGAAMRGADLTGAILDQAYMRSATLDQAILRDASLRFADLRQTSIVSADLSGTDLSFADCADANATNSVFPRATFARARTLRCSFDGADIRHSAHILVDECLADRLQIEGSASDPWSTLRREYTGPRYLVHLLLTIAFLLPFAISVFHLSAVDEAYRTISTLAAERGGEPMESKLPRAALRESVEVFDRHHVRVPSAAVLLGWPQGWWFLVMTAVVVAYNAMRVVLTIGIPWYWPGGVTALRDAEERSHITPSLEEYYGPLHPITDGYKRHVLGWREAGGRLVPPERERGEFHQSVREAWWLLRVWAMPSLKRGTGRRNRFKDFGLYRLHQAAVGLLILAVAAFLLRALLWIMHSRVPIPVDSLL